VFSATRVAKPPRPLLHINANFTAASYSPELSASFPGFFSIDPRPRAFRRLALAALTRISRDANLASVRRASRSPKVLQQQDNRGRITEFNSGAFLCQTLSTQIPSPSDSFGAFHVSVKRDALLYLHSFNVVILFGDD